MPDDWLARSLWAVAVVAYAVYVLNAFRGEGTDFLWVHQGTKAFIEGGDPYDIELFVNPPSAPLLLAPFGTGSFESARDLFLPLNAAALAAGALVSTAAFGLRWTGVAGAAILLAFANMPAVGLTLALGNVNGLVFLAEAVALLAIVRDRWSLAGVALGASFAIKPILVPLIVFPLLARRWGSVALAIAVPAALSAVAVVLNTGALGFFTEAVPFLLDGNHPHLRPFNVALVGVADTLGLPSALGELVRLAVLGGAVLLAVLRWRQTETDAAGARLRLAETAGLVLLATLLCFSFSWEYYGLYLVPLVVSVADPRSLLRNSASFVGLLLMFSPIDLVVERYAEASKRFEQVRPAIAWLLILAGMAWVTWSRRSVGAHPRAAHSS